jgi:hypothetical protein
MQTYERRPDQDGKSSAHTLAFLAGFAALALLVFLFVQPSLPGQGRGTSEVPDLIDAALKDDTVSLDGLDGGLDDDQQDSDDVAVETAATGANEPVSMEQGIAEPAFAAGDDPGTVGEAEAEISSQDELDATPSPDGGSSWWARLLFGTVVAAIMGGALFSRA